MNNFKSNYKRNRFKFNGDRGFRKRNGNGHKINGEFNNNPEFKRRNPGKNNQNAAKLIEKYNDLAREAMSKAGLPIALGSPGPISNSKEASLIAEEIGFPVILKAAAGGGGIGMQVVESSEEFESAMKLCQGRALSAFGDDRVFLEKFIEGAQHIEFQVLADGKNAIHFGERFCSIQRRHQFLCCF